MPWETVGHGLVRRLTCIPKNVDGITLDDGGGSEPGVGVGSGSGAGGRGGGVGDDGGGVEGGGDVVGGVDGGCAGFGIGVGAGVGVTIGIGVGGSGDLGRCIGVCICLGLLSKRAGVTAASALWPAGWITQPRDAQRSRNKGARTAKRRYTAISWYRVEPSGSVYGTEGAESEG